MKQQNKQLFRKQKKKKTIAFIPTVQDNNFTKFFFSVFLAKKLHFANQSASFYHRFFSFFFILLQFSSLTQMRVCYKMQKKSQQIARNNYNATVILKSKRSWKKTIRVQFFFFFFCYFGMVLVSGNIIHYNLNATHKMLCFFLELVGLLCFLFISYNGSLWKKQWGNI